MHLLIPTGLWLPLTVRRQPAFCPGSGSERRNLASSRSMTPGSESIDSIRRETGPMAVGSSWCLPITRWLRGKAPTIQRERVSAGLVVVLPNNRLVISPDLSVCKPNGRLVEVTAAAVLEPSASIRNCETPARPARGRRLWWVIAIAIALTLSAAVVLVRYPALQEVVRRPLRKDRGHYPDVRCGKRKASVVVR
jgi:hypothetical protein